MARRQTRRTLSVRIESWRRLQAIAAKLDTSTSALVESYIEALGNREGVPVPDRAALIAEANRRNGTATRHDIRARMDF